MAWTDVITRATGYVVTATNWNEFVNNFKAIGDPWGSYTVAWTAATTNPTLGNGTRSGSYIQAGKLIIGRALITVGTTTTVGTGAYRFSLPVAASTSSNDCVGSFIYNDASGSQYSGALELITSTTCAARQGAGGSFGAASPVVPANNDTYGLQFIYEAA